MTPDLTLSTLACPHYDDLQGSHARPGYCESRMNISDDITVEGAP